MKLTTKKILALVAGGLAIIAFVMAFVSPLKVAKTGDTAPALDVWFGTERIDGTILPFIGFILALLGGAYLIVRQFINISNDKIFFWIAIALLVVGAILILLTETFFIATLIKEVPEAFKAEAKTMYAEIYALNIGAILGGVLAILSAVCAVVTEKFIKD